MFKFSERLKWAYASSSQIRGKVSKSYQERAIKSLSQIEKIFTDKLQGKSTSLRNAILKGKSGGLNGVPDNYFNDRFNEEGVGAAASGALIAAASAIIGLVAKIFKKNGLSKDGDLDPEEIITKLKSTLSNDSGGDEIMEFDENGNIMPNAQPKDKSPNKIMKLIKDNPVKSTIGGLGILGLGAWGISALSKSKKAKALPPQSQSISGYSKNKKASIIKIEKLK